MASKDNVTPEEVPEVSSEPQEEETPESAASSAEESAEPTQESAPDADGASEETEEPATEGGDVLFQHPDGRFEVKSGGHFPVIVEVTPASQLPGDEPGVKSR